MIASINQVRQLGRQGMYPALYPWVVGMACLDVVLTCIVLGVGGREANAVARGVIGVAGVPGMILLKAVAVAAVLAICEYVGRRRPGLGRRLAECAVGANTAAVAMGCAFMVLYWVELGRA